MDKPERIIEFEDGKLFGPKLTSDIKENDCFIDCYKKAAKQTKEILQSNDEEIYKIKNIIAFLGNRGQGKTSMMRSYVNALVKKNNILFAENSLKNYNFIDLDIIDPSTFEKFSNVLDIVLAQLFDRIQKKREDEYKNIGNVLNQFNMIYSQIAIIKDKTILDRNFEIYEGSIESLITISDVSKFKTNLNNLVNDCLKIIGDENKTNVLVISIDDIDIDLSNCYETIETVRKYLNIPHVLVVMAAKLEQLHEGIRMENLKRIEKLSHTDTNRVYEDIYNMATKYLLKILPQNRRIHIPDLVNDISLLRYDVKIKCNNEDKYNTLQSLFSNLLFNKTGILVLNSDQVHNYLLNGNLRDMIDFYSCLSDMEMPQNKKKKNYIYLRNLEKFKDYFLNNWCTNNLTFKSARLVRKLYKEGSIYKNHSLIQMITELEKDNSNIKKKLQVLLKQRGKRELYYDLSDVSYYLNKVENHNIALDIDDSNKFVYAVKMCYTIIMNQLRFIDNLKYVSELKENENYPSNYLLNFVGGRILKEEIMLKNNDHREDENYKENINKICNDLNKKIKEEIKNVKEDKNSFFLMILLSTTSKDIYRDIYFYNHKNTAIKEFFFDPFLFFVNCLDIQFTYQYRFNKKFDKEINELVSEEKLSEVFKTRESLEYVAKTVICNFSIYDFLIDYLDIRFKYEKDKIELKSLYILMISWLDRLENDLKKQYGENNLEDVFKHFKTVKEELKKIEKVQSIEIEWNSQKVGFKKEK